MRPLELLRVLVRQLALPLLGLALAGLLAGCASHGSSGPAARTPSSAATTPASGFEGALLPAGLKPHEFALTDQHGRPVSLRDFRGRVTILAFLSSTSRAALLIGEQLRGALDELALEHDRPAVPALAVSVDPAGDTPARVRAYLHTTALSGRLEYLTGSPARLRAVWRAYRVLPASAGAKAYEEGAFVVLLDRAGAPRVEIPLEALTPEVLARDVRRLEAL